jgi:peptidyl-prolyl cis-trans isomerase C
MITDADLKKEYDATIAQVKDEKEVRARHILVPTEQEAKDAKKKNRWWQKL